MKYLQQNHVKYGLFMSIATALCILFMHFTGQYSNPEKRSPIEMLFIIFVPIIIWYLGIKARKKALKEKLPFKEGFFTGVKISLVYALTSPFIFLVYYTINPSVIDFMKKEYMMPDASTGQIIAFDMLVQFLAALIMGSLYGAVISLFLKTRK